MFVIELAGIPVAVNNRYSYVRDISQDYMTDKSPELTVALDTWDFEYERACAIAVNPDSVPPLPMLESAGIYRKIADELWQRDAFMFHGAALVLSGKAYLFTARSGVGKTTHIRLWLSRFKEEARVLNGDKPLIRMIDGEVYVSGTPWRGKESYGEPGMYPLAGIAFLERAEQNSAYPISSDEALLPFVTQAYMPKQSAESGVRLLRLFNHILTSTPLIRLKCNMSEDAAEAARCAFSEAEKRKLENKDRDNSRSQK